MVKKKRKVKESQKRNESCRRTRPKRRESEDIATIETVKSRERGFDWV